MTGARLVPPGSTGRLSAGVRSPRAVLFLAQPSALGRVLEPPAHGASALDQHRRQWRQPLPVKKGDAGAGGDLLGQLVVGVALQQEGHVHVGVLDEGLERVQASAGHVAEPVDEDVDLDVVGANLQREGAKGRKRSVWEGGSG
eukprot:scaffold1908_cov104-Isochrysis_galbana.AAC.11